MHTSNSRSFRQKTAIPFICSIHPFSAQLDQAILDGMHVSSP